MNTKDETLEIMKADTLNSLELFRATLKFGTPEQVEAAADEMRRKLFDLSLRAGAVKNPQK